MQDLYPTDIPLNTVMFIILQAANNIIMKIEQQIENKDAVDIEIKGHYMLASTFLHLICKN